MDADDRTPVTYLGLPAWLVPVPDAPAPPLYRTASGLVAEDLAPAAGTGRLLRIAPAPDAPPESVRSRDGLAESIVMGPVTVPLDSHVAIAYGLRAGLLETVEEQAPPSARVELDAPATLGVACPVRPAEDAEEAPALQRVLYGWFLGMPLVHNVAVPGYYGGTAPDEPDPALPSMRCYLTAPVDDAAPSSPVRQVPTRDGMRTLPSHQNTTDKHPGSAPHNNFGYFVVRGPRGGDDTVRVRPAPPDGLPPEPLAYRMRLGDRWVGLNNHLVIEYGVAEGLLGLVPLEYGGQMWTSFPGRTQLAVDCADTGMAPAGAPDRLTEGTLDIKKADMDLMGRRANSPVAPGARRVAVSCAGLAFQPEVLRVRAGEDVAIELTATDVMHNLEIEELDFYVQADAGQTAAGGLRVDRPGTYAFHCSLMAHRAAGMTGRLVVEP